MDRFASNDSNSSDWTNYSIARCGIEYYRVMVIDHAVAIIFSLNFTKAAEQNNAENLLVLRSKELATVYIENWDGHKRHSERYGVR